MPAERTVWRALAVLSLIPAIAYAGVVFAMVAGVQAPAIWVNEHWLAGPWAGLILWPLVAGGPMFGVICSLILGLRREDGITLGRVCGVLGWTLLILNLILLFPFPWIFCID